MNAKYFSIIAITTVIVLTVLFFIFYHRRPGIQKEKPVVVKNVTVITIEKIDVDDFYEASGVIEVKTISTVSSRIMGTVLDVLVNQGDKVKAGQQLLIIDNNDLAQKVNAAQANYNEATKAADTASKNRKLALTTYDRYKNLFDEKAISGQEMDQITNKKDQAVLEFQRAQASGIAAKANLEGAKVNLDFSNITSPVNGVVTNKNIEKGNMATPGTPLLTIEDTSGFKAQAYIDEHMSHQVVNSTPVNVVVDSIARTFKGTINEIVPSIDTSSRTFLVKAVIAKDANEHLLANGLYAKILIPQNKRSILAVPLPAIVQRGQLTGVYVIGENNRVSFRMIRTAKTYGNLIEVLSGINEGDRIVAEDVNNVFEGETIGTDVY